MKAWAFFCFIFLPRAAPCSDPKPPIKLPTTFRNHLIFLTPENKSGTRLNFLADTGGGTFIYQEVASAMNLIDGEHSQQVKDLHLKSGSILPLPTVGGGFPVFKKPNQQKHLWTGMLGSFWHADRTWMIDYRNQTMFWLSQLPGDLSGFNKVKLGFQRNESKAKTSHFPSIQMEIDGRVINVLLDTGAQANLSTEAMVSMDHKGSEPVATSFIVEALFQSWRRNNPSWRVIEGGDSGAGGQTLIEVPRVRIGGYWVGPSWFATRPNAAFREYMAQWMVGPLDGAVGGSVLKFFKLILDYPGDKAYFQKYPEAR